MKIPGYKHLVEDILPDLNNYIDPINLYVCLGSWGVLEKVEAGMFYFSDCKSHSFLSLYKNHCGLLRTILSYYLYAKYEGIFNIHTDCYPEDHYIMVGVPFNGVNLKDGPDSRYVHFYRIIFTTDDIGRLEEDIPSGALNPIEVASWPIKIK